MTIYIIACGKQKSQHPVKARQMYIGSYFKACLQYAESQINEEIFILSAKYGLVELDKIIEPYDLLITDNESVSTEYIKQQAMRYKILRKKIVILGGKKYVNIVSKIWEDVTCPLKGGLLSQISWMNKQTEIVKATKQMELWR